MTSQFRYLKNMKRFMASSYYPHPQSLHISTYLDPSISNETGGFRTNWLGHVSPANNALFSGEPRRSANWISGMSLMSVKRMNRSSTLSKELDAFSTFRQRRTWRDKLLYDVPSMPRVPPPRHQENKSQCQSMVTLRRQDFLEVRRTTLVGTKRSADMDFSRLSISFEETDELLTSSHVTDFNC